MSSFHPPTRDPATNTLELSCRWISTRACAPAASELQPTLRQPRALPKRAALCLTVFRPVEWDTTAYTQEHAPLRDGAAPTPPATPLQLAEHATPMRSQNVLGYYIVVLNAPAGTTASNTPSHHPSCRLARVRPSHCTPTRAPPSQLSARRWTVRSWKDGTVVCVATRIYIFYHKISRPLSKHPITFIFIILILATLLISAKGS